MRPLAAVESAQVEIVQPVVHAGKDALRHVPVLEAVRRPFPVQDDGCVQVKAGKLDVILQHLLPLRLGPVGGGAVPEKSAAYAVIDGRRPRRRQEAMLVLTDAAACVLAGDVGHAVQRLAEHGGVELFAGGAVEVQDKAQDGRVGKFWFTAKPAVGGVVGPGDYPGNAVNQRILNLGAGGDAPGVFAAAAQQVAGLFVEPRLVGAVGVLKLHQHGEELVGGQIGRAADKPAVGRQEGGGGPAAHVVAGVDVRAVVVVHPHGEKAAGQQGLHVRVGIGGFVHHVARVAPRGGYGQQHRLVLGLRPVKGGTRPRQPFDAVRLIGVGRETKAGHYACPEPAEGTAALAGNPRPAMKRRDGSAFQVSI